MEFNEVKPFAFELNGRNKDKDLSVTVDSVKQQAVITYIFSQTNIINKIK